MYNPTPPNYASEAFAQYKRALFALLPIDSDEKAKEYGRLFAKFHHCEEPELARP